MVPPEAATEILPFSPVEAFENEPIPAVSAEAGCEMATVVFALHPWVSVTVTV